MARREALQQFLDAAFVGFDRFSVDIRSRGSVTQAFALLDMPGPQKHGDGSRLPACSYLDQALSAAAIRPGLDNVIRTFRLIEPGINWTARSNPGSSASSNFVDGHANAMVIGPGGLEDRNDVWFGASLMAPNVRYPDHDHPPEETYLVLSKGEFKQQDNDWFSPGVGGSFYNPPGIKHAMRSVDTPLLAFWVLLVNQPKH